MNEYDKQAKDFLAKTETTFQVEFLKYDYHFYNDKEKRDIYKTTLKRGNREFSFDFGQSINSSMQWIANTIYAKNACHKLGNPRLFGKNKNEMFKNAGLSLFGWNNNDFVLNKNFEEPTPYSVLACLTNYDPGSFEDFCSEFDYDTDSIKANKVYKAVVDEWKNVAMLWNDSEIEELQEIQ